ncbi:hypothetical protein LG943_10685 [Streptomonospora sp. S1-112]|uniref:Secreted protein n=1 Tax=Streptomonospora mangrovi TaxID=2883123 RepID=A0A9X3NQB3_9ACTN|nr:hypothetical protein [Streptomonospora mangrovi]MDA0564785.1 hypothetical protein [Streptomonospora mangrovi]
MRSTLSRRSTRTPLIRTALAAVPLALALGLSGCGSDGGAADAAASPSMDPDEMAVAFAECMREHGVPMEDPEPGEGVRIQMGPDSGVDQETMDAAMRECEEYRMGGDAMGGPDPEMQEAAQAFAECMREEGVEDYPDPDPDMPGIKITPELKADPELEAAMETCREHLPNGGPGGGGQ